MIITPYDAQRALIERQLKDDGLPWEHVFNVDSFQGRRPLDWIFELQAYAICTGNEADIVLV